MHTQILGAALLTLGALANANATSACPRTPTALIEHFIGADCERCWQTAGASAPWRLDWILPSPSGDAAPLATAALTDGAERAARAGVALPAADGAAEQRTPLAVPRQPLRLSVLSGPAWNGYLAVQYDLGRGAPADSKVWVAIVESIPAGTEGSPDARELVRAVAGPFGARPTASADGATPMVALRAPATPQPQRLSARAWVEGSDGRLLAIASEACPAPAARRR
jgi:hypothetical protein